MSLGFLLTSLSVFLFAQENNEVGGVLFPVVKLAKQDDYYLVQFDDKAVFTDSTGLEKTVLEYYYDELKSFDSAKTLSLLQALISSSRLDLASIPFRRICKLDLQPKFELLSTLKNMEQFKVLANHLPRVDPDPECLLVFFHERIAIPDLTIIDTDLFLLKTEKVIDSLINKGNFELLMDYLHAFLKLIDLNPVLDISKYPKVHLIKVLGFLTSHKIELALPEKIFPEKLDQTFISVVQASRAQGKLNCNNFLLLYLQNPSEILSELVSECITEVFSPSKLSISKNLINHLCKIKTDLCFEKLIQQIKSTDFYAHISNIEAAVQIASVFEEEQKKKIQREILYNLSMLGDKHILKLLEKKYLLSLTFREKLAIFVRKNLFTASLLTLLLALVCGTGYLIKLKRIKSGNTAETKHQAQSFVKIRKASVSSEYRDYVNLLKEFSLKPGASLKQIKKAYFELSKKFHPDKFGGDSSKFIAIKTSYEKLLEYHEKFKLE
ncbi:MAG: J domain-containing protein [Deltaproteobacteria bacterium]|nr:J domain-containing protein [Deltaproteobacteria bacterium]